MGALFDAVRAGDRAAIDELERWVRTFARRACRGGGLPGLPDLDAREVARLAGRELLEVGLERYDGGGSERGHVQGLVKATVIRMARRAARGAAREASAEPEPAAGRPAQRLEVVRILEKVSPDCRRLLWQVFLRDDRCADLARETGLPEPSVRERLGDCVRSARRGAAEQSS